MQLTHLGPYRIDRPLGKGGMGSVYAATDTETGQRVAIKALTPHLAMAEGFRERFEAEIESLKTLRHEGIVRLYGYGEQDGVLFYSMELVEGISLEDELRAGRRFNWREVTSIAIQLSLALKHAHDHGIVHRDIKPANILLYDEERVKLADFGIARLFGATQLTTAGGVLGTADYMSPEQAEGRPVTARCDQYSLGGVMYALLAGRPPFLAKNLPQMLQLQRFAQAEMVRRYAPDTPEQLERVIAQLLSKDPADRFPNTQVLARHLQAMALALSRPISQEAVSADDFALGDEHAPGEHPGTSAELSLAMDAPQDEATGSQRANDLRPALNKKSGAKATHDAATMAAEEPSTNQLPASSSVAVAAAGGAAPALAERPARFTTLEEEEARLLAERGRPRLLVAAQLAGLAAVLAGFCALAVYLSRPPSADDLYERISAQVESDDDMLLASVAGDIDKFLGLYPNDPRTGELERHKERIELDKLGRKLQRQARGEGIVDSSLLAAEQLYLQAVSRLETSPEESAAMLRSLVDLYAVSPQLESKSRPPRSQPEVRKAWDDHVRTAAIVQLAKRRLAALESDLARQRKRHVALLEERLETAKRVTTSEPQRAAGMYRAIIDLHGSDAWADEIVEEARSRLAELEATDR
jgi:serine/threonine-protein kinase